MFVISLRNTSGWVLLMRQHSKFFGGSKFSSDLTLKTKWYYGCCDDFWRSVLQIKIWKKKTDFKPLSLSDTANVCYYYDTWVTGVNIAYVFVDRNSRGKTIEWLFKSSLRPFSYYECSTALWLLLCTQATKTTHLQELAVCLRPRLSPDNAQNRVFVKSANCIQILDVGVVWVWSAAFFAVIINWKMPY